MVGEFTGPTPVPGGCPFGRWCHRYLNSNQLSDSVPDSVGQLTALSFPPPPEMLSPDGASLISPPALQLWGDNDAVALSSNPLATGPLCSLSTVA